MGEALRMRSSIAVNWQSTTECIEAHIIYATRGFGRLSLVGVFSQMSTQPVLEAAHYGGAIFTHVLFLGGLTLVLLWFL